jgi:hypothetical protein
MAESSNEVSVLDLTKPGGDDAFLDMVDRDNAGLLGLTRRVVVVDETTKLMDHHHRYERLATLPQVDKVICVVIGGVGGVAGQLQQPTAMTTVAAVLWVGSQHGVHWSGGADRADPSGREHADGLHELIRTLRVAEVFDEVYRRTREFPYHTASPGLDVEWIDVPEQVVTQQRVVALRSATATGLAGRGQESASRLTEALDRAAAVMSQTRRQGADPMPADAVLERARADAQHRLRRATAAVEQLSGVTGLLGTEGGVRNTTPHLVAAGKALGEYLRLVTDTVRGVGANLASGHPPVHELVELGLPQPWGVDRAALSSDVAGAVTADLRAGRPLPEISSQLRRFAVRSAPQGAVSAQQELASSNAGSLAAQLTSPPAVAFGWPTPLTLLTGMTLVTCLAAAGLPQSGGLAGPLLSLAGMLTTALLLARCTNRAGTLGAAVVLDWSLVAVGAAAAVGVVGGRFLLSRSITTLSPGTELMVIVILVATMLGTGVAGWTMVVRAWSREIGVQDAAAAYLRLSQLLETVISSEWLPAHQRRQLADTALVVASVIDDVEKAATETLAVLEESDDRSGSGVRSVVLDERGGPELVDVLRQDLAELTILAVSPCLDGIRRGTQLSVQAGQYADYVRRLFTDYTTHLETHGVHALPPGITNDAPRHKLRVAMWHHSGSGRRILDSNQHSELVQLCTSGEVRLLNTAGAGVFHFAPQDARDAFDADDVTWTAASAVGAVRLVPLRSGLVEIVPVRGEGQDAGGSRL